MSRPPRGQGFSRIQREMRLVEGASGMIGAPEGEWSMGDAEMSVTSGDLVAADSASCAEARTRVRREGWLDAMRRCGCADACG